MKQTFYIQGMECAHCEASVRKALEALDGVISVSVDRHTGTAVIDGEISPETVREAVYDAGFTVKE